MTDALNICAGTTNQALKETHVQRGTYATTQLRNYATTQLRNYATLRNRKGAIRCETAANLCELPAKHTARNVRNVGEKQPAKQRRNLDSFFVIIVHVTLTVVHVGTNQALGIRLPHGPCVQRNRTERISESTALPGADRSDYLTPRAGMNYKNTTKEPHWCMPLQRRPSALAI